jgi:hypothetical protein
LTSLAEGGGITTEPGRRLAMSAEEAEGAPPEAVIVDEDAIVIVDGITGNQNCYANPDPTIFVLVSLLVSKSIVERRGFKLMHSTLLSTCSCNSFMQMGKCRLIDDVLIPRKCCDINTCT